MTIHKLSRCSRAELGIDGIVAGKVYAYTAVVGDRMMQLGIAVANEPGYHPIPAFFAWADTYDEMEDHADELNTELGLTPNMAARIVGSSMAAGKVSA